MRLIDFSCVSEKKNCFRSPQNRLKKYFIISGKIKFRLKKYWYLKKMYWWCPLREQSKFNSIYERRFFSFVCKKSSLLPIFFRCYFIFLLLFLFYFDAMRSVLFVIFIFFFELRERIWVRFGFWLQMKYKRIETGA